MVPLSRPGQDGDAPSAGRSGDELAQEGAQRRTQVVALAGQPDDGLEVVQPVAGVVAPAAEDDAVDGLAALDEGGQRVGQLDLAAAAGLRSRAARRRSRARARSGR